MNYFIMKTLTTNGDWFTFSMEDLPVLLDDEHFALFGQSKSPWLRIDSIRRGDPEYGLYEGEVLSMDGENWLVCYERGFYVISESYVIRYLDDLSDYQVIGNVPNIKINVPVSFRANHLFKVKDNIFRIQDVVGAFNGKLLLRPVNTPVDVTDVQQECCATYEGKRVYLGDILDGAELKLYHGRLARMTNAGAIDITTGRAV